MNQTFKGPEMTPEQFCYWLQGYIEMEKPEVIGSLRTQVLKEHLNLVFDKQTPNYGFKHTDGTPVTIGDLPKELFPASVIC